MNIPTENDFKTGKTTVFCDKVVIIAEKSCGNESVGSMWFDTKIFESTATLYDVLVWAEKHGVDGKLIITVPDTRVNT